MESKGDSPTPSRSLEFVTLGHVDRDITQYVARYVSKRSGLPHAMGPAMDPPEYAFDERRGQYDSKAILKRITALPIDSLRVLAITGVDLFVPILKYVFGLAQVGGPCAVISTHRLDPRFYGLEPDRHLLMERTGKTALHELGHSLGLTHCRDRRCVMYSSAKIGDTDYKRLDFCPTCHELFRWRLDR